MADVEEDNYTLQTEELEVLESIYVNEFTLEEQIPPTFTIVIRLPNGKEASLFVTFTPGYPREAPPIYQISVPWIRGEEKLAISDELEELYLEHIGKNIVYIWAEKLRELLDKDETRKNTPQVTNLKEDCNWNIEQNISALRLEENTSGNANVDFDQDRMIPSSSTNPQSSSRNNNKFTIVTGEAFTDRKSTFQAHVAVINDQSEVSMVLDELKQNKKISTATHNMYAYRILNEGSNTTFKQDCEDDGESHAGSRLLHLLKLLDSRNVMVIVTRWYGGVQLHADRFKHINNVARELLEQQGFVRATK